MADELVPQGSNPLSTMQGQQGQGAETARPINAGSIQNMLMRNRRVLILLAGTLMLAGFLGLVLWSSDPSYRAVYTGNEKDAASIVSLLQKEQIPYRLEGAGTVLIPADQVYAVRLKLASQDMLPGNGTGFEIFDQSSEFGISDFAQQVNLQRAMQGELARTIEILPQVSAARVHLVLPKESAFAERDRKATASVMLQLMGGQRLPKQTVQAIQNLVSAAVPDLDRSQVTVVDSSGNLLSGSDDKEPSSEGQTMQEYQASLEHRMEDRLTSMLEQVVGSGQAVVRVTAKINREYVEQNSQRYNPDEQVLRSEKSISESRRSSDGTASGVPGVASNTPGNNPNVAADGSLASNMPSGEEANRREVANDYEISSTQEHKVIPFGGIDRLSVAVVVGGTTKTDAEGNSSFVPRNAEELKSLRGLVEGAVGYNEDRGDTLQIQSMPLVSISSAEETDGMFAANKSFWLELARYGVAALALVLLGWFLLRPLARHLQPGAKDDPTQARAVQRLAGMSDEAYDRLEKIERVRQAIQNDPQRAGKVVREWTETV